MRPTTAKTLRDLRRQRAASLAVMVTIALGVMLYVATAGAYQNLDTSYRATYDRLHFATYLGTGGDPATVAAAALAAGASQATTRAQYDVPMTIEGTKLLGRVIGVPTDAHPTVDDVDVIAGSYFDPGATDQALIESHAADTFGVGVGDQVQVYTTDGWQSVTITGVVESPEYIWPARSRQEVISDPHSFAVLYLPETTVESWYGPANQTLVVMPDPTTTSSDNAVTQAMTAAGATAIQTWQEQPSQATLAEDLAGFKEMSVAFPALFLTAAAMAGYVMMARRIMAERSVIGTLMAAGARRHRVLRMYLTQGLLIGVAGGILGVLIGALLNGAVTRAYTSALGIPDTVVDNYPVMILAGLAFGVLVGLLGALFPALSASRTSPATAMRPISPTRPPGAWSRYVARRRRLPISVRMAMRDIGRSRRRTFATMLGAVLALVLVLSSVGLMTSMVSALSIQYDQVDTQDATVAVSTGSETAATLAAVPGVAAVEPTLAGPVTARSSTGSYTTTLRGYQPDTVMHQFLLTDGTSTTLPPTGVLAGSAIGPLLDVAVGDTITVSSASGDTPMRIEGFLDEPLGTFLYTTTANAEQVLPDTGVSTFALTFDPGVDRDQMRQAVTALDGVIAYDDTKAIVSMAGEYLGLFWAFVLVMVVLGGLLALTVMYVTMAANIAERTGELATMRAAGVPVGKVAGAISAENLLATALGVPIGLLLGTLSARAFLASFSDDMFTLSLRWSWWVPVVAALGVLAAAALSRWPAARAVRRIDVARVVRERAI